MSAFLNRQRPIVQAVAGAVLVSIALTAIHIGTGTRPGDPLVFMFIGALALIGAALTFVRARARERSGGKEGELRMMGSPPILALLFVLTVA